MKSFTTAAAVLALATLSSGAAVQKRQSACILQTVTNPNQQQVEDSINQWLADVETVNGFLNSAADLIAANDPSNLQAQAQAAFTNAVDEPCQLMTLASQPDFSDGPAAFTCAVQDLMNVFQIHVLDNLQTIINDPSNTASVHSAVNDINAFRCCNVLGDASILWLDSADDNGISNVVTLTAPLEDACSSIICTNFCGTQDNGNFGIPGDIQG